MMIQYFLQDMTGGNQVFQTQYDALVQHDEPLQLQEPKRDINVLCAFVQRDAGVAEWKPLRFVTQRFRARFASVTFWVSSSVTGDLRTRQRMQTFAQLSVYPASAAKPRLLRCCLLGCCACT